MVKMAFLGYYYVVLWGYPMNVYPKSYFLEFYKMEGGASDGGDASLERTLLVV